MEPPKDRRPDDVEETSQESFPASDPPAWTNVVGEHVRAPSNAGDATKVEHDTVGRRFVIRAGPDVAELTYRLRGKDTIELVHTEVPPSLQGRGIASRLARAALEYAREQRLSVVVICPFVKTYVKRHPEFDDIIIDSGH